MDLDVVLSSGERPGEYGVRVSSPAGQAVGKASIDVDGLLRRRRDLQSAVLASAVKTRRALETTEVPIRSTGEELFRSVFTGAMYGRYAATVAAAHERGESLRLVLHTEATELAPIPWEMLFDPDSGEYLCQREPLVRHVDIPTPVPPMTVQRPLRVLGIVAAPTNLARLDVAAEQRRLEEALLR